jgi:hypothetical protein
LPEGDFKKGEQLPNPNPEKLNRAKTEIEYRQRQKRRGFVKGRTTQSRKGEHHGLGRSQENPRTHDGV